MSEKLPSMTVADLKVALADIPDYVWVCLKDGPLQLVEQELGAAEPFIVLQRIDDGTAGKAASQPNPGAVGEEGRDLSRPDSLAAEKNLMREFTCGWKYFDPLEPHTEQRGHIKVKAHDLSDAIVQAKKAVFRERDLSAARVEIVTIEWNPRAKS